MAKSLFEEFDRDRPTSPRSPWQNGCAERLISSIRRECLDHVVVFGERHLRHVLLSYMNYYNEMRTHLSLDKDAPLSRHGSEGGAYSSPSNPGRAASPIYSDLICDRHRRSSARGLPSSWPSGTHRSIKRKTRCWLPNQSSAADCSL